MSEASRARMTLYQTFLSPFPTRVRLVLYAKGIEVDLVEPPGFRRDEPKGEYLALNPIGRVPTLVLPDGRALPESEVICEYLEDAFPEPSLRPADAWHRGRARLLARICDVYVVMAMVPLFDTLGTPRAAWSRPPIDAALARLAEALGYLEAYIGTEGYAVGRRLSHADGALAPMIVLATEWAPALFGGPDPWAGRPRLAAYWQAIQRDPIAARVIAETRHALAERQAERQRAAGAA